MSEYAMSDGARAKDERSMTRQQESAARDARDTKDDADALAQLARRCDAYDAMMRADARQECSAIRTKMRRGDARHE